MWSSVALHTDHRLFGCSLTIVNGGSNGEESGKTPSGIAVARRKMNNATGFARMMSIHIAARFMGMRFGI